MDRGGTWCGRGRGRSAVRERERERGGSERGTVVEPRCSLYGEWPERCKMSYARALEAVGITKPLEHCTRQPLVTLSKVSIT